MRTKEKKSVLLVFVLCIGLLFAFTSCTLGRSAGNNGETDENGGEISGGITSGNEDEIKKPNGDEPGEFDGTDIVIDPDKNADNNDHSGDGATENEGSGEANENTGNNENSGNTNTGDTSEDNKEEFSLLSLEEYISLSEQDQIKYYNHFDTPQEFFVWYKAAVDKYNEEHPGEEFNGGDVNIGGWGGN